MKPAEIHEVISVIPINVFKMVEGLLSTLHWQLRIRHFHKQDMMDRANAYSEDLLILFPYIANDSQLHLVDFRVRMDLLTI
jgi:hypothetical protein